MVAITALSPKACTASDLAAFKEMVIKGGEVNPITLPNLVEQALALAFARLDNILVGVGAIKCPYESHRSETFENAKSLLNPSEFEFELGWFYVNPSTQGNRLASKLVQALMPALEGRATYSTSKTNNYRMHSSLRGAGFAKEGTPYPSKLNDQYIQLFVCR